MAHDVAEAMGMGRGPRLTFSAACASGLEALIRGVLMIRFGEARRVLVVASESSLHPLFLASFQRLGVLPREGIGCRPFDEGRDGFLMSEAAAAICLSGDDEPRPRLSIDRCAFAGDATHLTAGDPAGATLRRLLNIVVDGRPVDLFHAHGTGTDANDPLEVSAIETAISDGAPRPWLYSHKGALGHSLGASGLVSVAINAMIHREGIIPPNIQTHRPIPMQRLRLQRSSVGHDVRRSIILAAGFGGAMAAMSLQTPKPADGG